MDQKRFKAGGNSGFLHFNFTIMLGLEDTFKKGVHKGKTVAEVIEEDFYYVSRMNSREDTEDFTEEVQELLMKKHFSEEPNPGFDFQDFTVFE